MLRMLQRWLCRRRGHPGWIRSLRQMTCARCGTVVKAYGRDNGD